MISFQYTNISRINDASATYELLVENYFLPNVMAINRNIRNHPNVKFIDYAIYHTLKESLKS